MGKGRKTKCLISHGNYNGSTSYSVSLLANRLTLSNTHSSVSANRFKVDAITRYTFKDKKAFNANAPLEKCELFNAFAYPISGGQLYEARFKTLHDIHRVKYTSEKV